MKIILESYLDSENNSNCVSDFGDGCGSDCGCYGDGNCSSDCGCYGYTRD